MYTATLSTANLNKTHRVEAIDSGFPVLGSPHCRIHVERANKEKGKGVRKERWASGNGRKTEEQSVRFSGTSFKPLVAPSIAEQWFPKW
jgi:hypothetical protein